MSGPPAPGAVVLVTVEQLRELLREQLDAAAAEHATDVRPALLDRRGLAGRLDVSLPTLDRLRAEGMPELRLGDSPRFELDACLRWLREKSSASSTSAGSAPALTGHGAK
jgi:hypothetical protein